MGSTNTTNTTTTTTTTTAAATTATGLTFDVPTLGLSEVAAMSTDELKEVLTESATAQAALAGLIALALAELARRQGFRDDGATSVEAWMVERTGVGPSSARTLARVGEDLFDLPHLSGALCSGALPLDKVRTVAGVATPETDAAWAAAAAEHSVRDLAELVRTQRPPTREDSDKEHETRSVRFNEATRTMTAGLPAESFAEVRACLEARAKAIPSDGETPWDQRLADALVSLVRSGGDAQAGPSRSPYIVVAHAPLDTVLGDAERCGELERGGLISADVVRRLACEARVIVALDDDAGHTVYEGHQSRDATPTQRRELMRRDRHCRFPGCRHVLFTVAHHVRFWSPPERGPTDMDNLALMCRYHHDLIHSSTVGWRVRGDPNVELTFTSPSGRVTTSRPSPLWTRVTAPEARVRPRDEG